LTRAGDDFRDARRFRAGAGATERRSLCLLVGAAVVLVASGCRPPRDYYRETAYMARLGEELRAQANRAPGQSVEPASAERAVVVPIALEPSPMRLEFAPEERPAAPRVDEGAVRERALQGQTPAEETGPAPTTAIQFDRARFSDFLRAQYEVAVLEAKAINGRLAGGANILRVEFIPRARSDESLLKEFLLICAATAGMDAQDTVDVVVGLAADAQLLPWMSLKASMADFTAYRDGRLSLKEWQKRVEIVRY
jgi:hypothetical protein